MTKGATKLQNELFMVVLLALVIMSAFVVVVKYSGTPVQSQKNTVSVEAASPTETELAKDLMMELNQTVGDTSNSDFVQMKNDANGL